ncbi:MAG: hypothetical protein ACK4UN_03480, partial [Limisphaerales bacterium]
MKARLVNSPGSLWLFLLLVSLVFAHGGPEQKTIHLRNDRIVTTGKAPIRKPDPTEKAVSGLYILQLTGPLQDQWRNELEGRGVKLLRYVPEDAFVVRVRQTKLSDLESLEFIRLVGSYRPDYKVHSSLQQNARAKPAHNVAIRVLLSPDAGPQEVARVRGLMTHFEKESPTRFGRILD